MIKHLTNILTNIITVINNIVTRFRDPKLRKTLILYTPVTQTISILIFLSILKLKLNLHENIEFSSITPLIEFL